MATFSCLRSLVGHRVRPAKVGVTSIRHMKLWVKPRILAFRHRKELEEWDRVYPKPPTPRYEFTDWNYDAELFAFGKRLAENFDKEVLRVALTDKAFTYQWKEKQKELGLQQVDQGDICENTDLAIEGSQFIQETLDTVLAQEYPLFPSEGRSAVVQYLIDESNIASISSNIGTRDLILSAEYPPSSATSAKVFHALVAAVVKSSGEERGRRFVLDLVLTQLVGKNVFEMWKINRPWQMLSEILQSEGKMPPEPRVIAQVGPNTVLAAYVIGLYDSEKNFLGKGTGETLEIAQEMAARNVLQQRFGFSRLKDTFDVFLSPRSESGIHGDPLKIEKSHS